MATREGPPTLGAWVLVAIEWLGQVLGLALAAVLHPVGRAALLLGRFLRRLVRRQGPPAGGDAEQEAEREPEPPPPPDPGPVPAGRGFAWGVAGVYVVAVVAWALFAVLRRVDSALGQMGVGGQPAGSGLGFPVSWTNVGESLGAGPAQEAVDAIRAAWLGYGREVAGATVLRPAVDVAFSLVLLDFCFLVLYAVLLAVALATLGRRNAGSPAPNPLAEQQRSRRGRMLYGAAGALGLLVLVDALENWQLLRSLVRGGPLTLLAGEVALGPLLSLLKVPLALVVVGAAGFVAVSLAAGNRWLREALTSIRGVLYAVAALVLVLMVGIGAAQVDDVIRAWDGWRAAWAVIACFGLAVAVAGVARRLSGRSREHPAPDLGRSAQPLLLGGGVLLLAGGQLVRLAGLGWGISVAGGLLVVLWAFGLPVDGLPSWTAPPLRRGPRWPAMAAVGAAGAGIGAALALLTGRTPLAGALLGAILALAALAAWSLRAAGAGLEPPRTPPVTARARQDDDPVAVALWGDRLGRVAGSVVAAAVVAAIARATALDAYVRETPDWDVLGWPLAGAAGAGVAGLVVCAYQARRVGPRPPKVWTTAWFLFTVAAVVAAAFLLDEDVAVGHAQAGGSVAVLLGGFLLFTGVLAVLAVMVRQGPITAYALAPALRALRFGRFPVLPFLVLWALVVSVLDAGGFHDIRRGELRGAGGGAPTIGQAWQQYVEAVPRAPAQPVVMVAAQGGGIRAAVWSALVMECIFGPGPVAGSGDLCAEGEGRPDPRRLAARAGTPLPVFLASGASGGSVGLAAWSARRADLVQDGPASTTPRTVEEALDRDFVAPDIARLLLADLPHTLLAWDLPDRAEMLERAWEEAWHERLPAGADRSQRGLTRGLRQTWSVTHANGSWTTPVLALNGISVEDDCRFLASAVDFTLPRQLPRDPAQVATAVGSGDDRPDDAACRGVAAASGPAVDILPSTSELIDYLCPSEDVPLSTAAHISARFPYVSPTGRVERRGCPGELGLVPEPAISYDADGGIFDNAGAGTAVDTWRALAPLAAATERATGRCLVPIFVQLDNSTGRATLTSAADPRPNELFAPLGATLGQLASREAYARAGAAAAFGRLVSAGGRRVRAPVASATNPLWFRIVLFGQPGPEPPLGWTLAPETVRDMRSQLRAGPNQRQIRALRAILAGNLACDAP